MSLGIKKKMCSDKRNELIARGRVAPLTDFEGNKIKERDPITGTKNVLWRIAE